MEFSLNLEMKIKNFIEMLFRTYLASEYTTKKYSLLVVTRK